MNIAATNKTKETQVESLQSALKDANSNIAAIKELLADQTEALQKANKEQQQKIERSVAKQRKIERASKRAADYKSKLLLECKSALKDARYRLL